MTNSLSITLIQSGLHWHNTSANLAMFEEKLWQINTQTDLIILPEMFNTGFTMDIKGLAEPMNSKTFRWMKQQAAQARAVVAGSFIVRDRQEYYNRLLWMEPDGTYAVYDKRHLFRMAGEHHTFAAGSARLVREIRGWKICPMVCYDLRFPVWSRNRWMEDDQSLEYDLLVFIANWPAARVNAWKLLLQARAVENLCFVAGVNRVGTDGNKIAYNGNSMVADPKGVPLWENEGEETIKTITLSMEELRGYRQKFPAYLDADGFSLQIPDTKKK